MIGRIISRLLRRRHYWRSVSFDQIAELYTSRLITVFAANIVNLFAAVYLYKLGYSLIFITLFYAVWYLMKIPFSYLAAKYAAYYGPKHGILLANLLRIPSLVAFALVGVINDHVMIAIAIFGLFQQMSTTLYNMCHMINFSKVKHIDRAGKEIGRMQQVEKIARVISPLVGGAIASIWSPEATIVLASILFVFSAVPLFRTVEPTVTRAKLRFRGFPWRLAIPSLVAETVVGFDFVASGMGWALFATLFVFSGLGEGVYAALGSIASLGVLVSMVAAWVFGRVIDKRKGDVLLVFGTVVNSILHVFRPFVQTPPAVIATNITSETATSAYAMPFTRVLFDVADTSGFRISYMMMVEMMLNLGAALGCCVLAVALMTIDQKNAFMVLFFVAAAYELIMLIVSRAAR